MKNKTKKLIILILLGLLFIIYIGGCFLFSNRFLFNSKINNNDVSFKTLQETNQILNNNPPVIKIIEKDINGNNINEEINLKELDSSINYDASDLLHKQNNYLWFLSFFNKSDKTCSKISGIYNNNKLNDLISNLYCLKPENIKEPVNAHLEIKDGGITLVSEDFGSYIKKETVTDLIKTTLDEFFISLDNNEIDLRDKYEIPSIYQDDPALISKKSTIENQLNKTLTIDVNEDNQVVLANKDLADLYTIENNELKHDEDKVNEFISSIVNKYNVSDYYYIDRASFKNALVNALDSNDTTSIKLDWIQETIKKFIEVDISKQTLYYYENDVLMLTSDVVTGNAEITDGTPTGTFSVTRMSTDSTLIGADYEEHVDFWIGFDQTGRIYGFHDASWRNEFGGDIYLHDPSRGCVNMPLEKITILFNYIDLGTEVYIH